MYCLSVHTIENEWTQLFFQVSQQLVTTHFWPVTKDHEDGFPSVYTKKEGKSRGLNFTLYSQVYFYDLTFIILYNIFIMLYDFKLNGQSLKCVELPIN